VALPAAQGMVAHAKGHWQEAIAHLQPILPQIWAIGGSHAQRDLFQQIYRDALLHEEKQPQKLARSQSSQSLAIAK
jgi:hypothetical protein